MPDETIYSIHTDVAFEPLEKIDVPALVAACKEPWFNQTLTKVNDCVVRLGILKGDFHWHVHDDEDEFFYVVMGELLVDVGEGTETLTSGQGITVPRGVLHRTRAPESCVVLMVEGAGVVPTGD